MKAKYTTIIFFLILVLYSCDRTETCGGITSCVVNLSKQQNPPLEIWSYTYNSQLVYLTKADCCDQYDQLYSSDCTLLCAPSGGLTGKGDGKCLDFYDKSTNPQLVWKAK